MGDTRENNSTSTEVNWDGRPYVLNATWDCLILLHTTDGVFHEFERQVFVQPRFDPVDPYQLILDYSFKPSVGIQVEQDVGLASWSMYRLSDMRWLHGNDFNPPVTGCTGHWIWLRLPNYDHPLR